MTVSVCRCAWLVVVALLVGAARVDAVEQLVFRRDGVEQTLVGRTVVTDRDGAVLFEGLDGRLWSVPKAEHVECL